MGSINSFDRLYDAVTGGDHIYLEGNSLRREEGSVFSRMGKAASKAFGGGISGDEKVRLARKVRELIDRDVLFIQIGDPVQDYDLMERIYTVLERLKLLPVEEHRQPIFADVRLGSFNLGRIMELKRILRGRGKNLALIEAIRRGDVEASLVLISRLDPRKFMKGEKERGVTPLHEACFRGPVLIAREIIRKLGSGDLGNTVTHQGSTALHVAALEGHREIVRELVSRMNEEDLGKQNDGGYSALHFACERGDRQMARDLLEKMRREDLGKVTNEGCSALHLACMRGDKDIAKDLLERMNPEDLGKLTNQGCSALDFACIQCVDVVKDLVERITPEDLGRVNTEGNTILHWASMGRHSAIFSELLRRMRPEDFGKLDNRGNTFLDYFDYPDYRKGFIPWFFNALGTEKFEMLFNFLPDEKKGLVLENLTQQQMGTLNNDIKAEYIRRFIIGRYETVAGEVLARSGEVALDLSRAEIPDVIDGGRPVDFSTVESRRAFLSRLLRVYDGLNLTARDFVGVEGYRGRRGDVERARRELVTMVSRIVSHEHFIAVPTDSQERERQYHILEKMLGHLIIKMENPETDASDKKTILFALANAGEYCFKRYMMEIAQKYIQNIDPNNAIRGAVEEAEQPEIAFERGFFTKLDTLKEQKFEEMYQERLRVTQDVGTVHSRSVAVELIGGEIGLIGHEIFGRDEERQRRGGKVTLGLYDQQTQRPLTDEDSRLILMTDFLENHYTPTFVFDEMTKYLNSLLKERGEGVGRLYDWIVSKLDRTDSFMKEINEGEMERVVKHNFLSTSANEKLLDRIKQSKQFQEIVERKLKEKIASLGKDFDEDDRDYYRGQIIEREIRAVRLPEGAIRRMIEEEWAQMDESRKAEWIENAKKQQVADLMLQGKESLDTKHIFWILLKAGIIRRRGQ